MLEQFGALVESIPRRVEDEIVERRVRGIFAKVIAYEVGTVVVGDLDAPRRLLTPVAGALLHDSDPVCEGSDQTDAQRFFRRQKLTLVTEHNADFQV